MIWSCLFKKKNKRKRNSLCRRKSRRGTDSRSPRHSRHFRLHLEAQRPGVFPPSALLTLARGWNTVPGSCDDGGGGERGGPQDLNTCPREPSPDCFSDDNVITVSVCFNGDSCLRIVCLHHKSEGETQERKGPCLHDVPGGTTKGCILFRCFLIFAPGLSEYK